LTHLGGSTRASASPCLRLAVPPPFPRADNRGLTKRPDRGATTRSATSPAHATSWSAELRNASRRSPAGAPTRILRRSCGERPMRLVGRPLPHRPRSRPTKRMPLRERERPGCNPVFQNIGAYSAAPRISPRSVAGGWTDSNPASRVCVLSRCRSAIASVPMPDAGDGLRPPQKDTPPNSRRGCRSPDPCGITHVVLAVVAFSLASFADGEHRAFPGDPAAAARAGLSRSRYLAARKQLVARGLVTVADVGGGRGRWSTLTLEFASSGPWLEGRINPGLFEAVLSYSRARGPARLLLAGLGALANEDREVVALTTEEIRVAAGLADSTYRRARAALLSAGEVVVDGCSGGRGNTNQWRLIDPRTLGPSLPVRTRVAPIPGARPLIAPARETPSRDVEHTDENPAHERTVSKLNPGQDRTVSELNPAQDRTVSELNPCQDRTVSELNPRSLCRYGRASSGAPLHLRSCVARAAEPAHGTAPGTSSPSPCAGACCHASACSRVRLPTPG
jgi:hypothetical protein